MTDPIDLTLDYLHHVEGKLDDLRADLYEVRVALRSLEDRQLGVERSIRLARKDVARRDRRSDAPARRGKRIERRLHLSDHARR